MTPVLFRKARVADIEAHVPARRERLGQHRQRRASIGYRIGIEANARGIATRRSGARGNVNETNRVARGVGQSLDVRAPRLRQTEHDQPNEYSATHHCQPIPGTEARVPIVIGCDQRIDVIDVPLHRNQQQR